MRREVVLLATIISSVWSMGWVGQHQDIESLLEQMRDPNTTAKAYQSIKHESNLTSEERQEISDALSQMIRNNQSREVWMNAVHLAGELKLNNAAPALAEQLRTPNTHVEGFVTFSREMNLVDDPAGKSLAEIGDPAVTYVSDELNSGDRGERFRCVYILTLIGSPLAIDTLREHLPEEKDPALRHLIQTVIDRLSKPN